MFIYDYDGELSLLLVEKTDLEWYWTSWLQFPAAPEFIGAERTEHSGEMTGVSKMGVDCGGMGGGSDSLSQQGWV